MAVNVYATLKQVLQDFIAPQLEALKGEISSLRIEIKRLDEKIDSVKNELKADIARVDEKLTAQVARIDEKLTFTNKRLDEALEIRERLAALEAKVGR